MMPRSIWPCSHGGRVSGWFSGPTSSVTEAIDDEDEPDGEQHLVELGRAVEPA